jgi:Methylase involved in ubiquinone/menaquinone biosynthesis
MTERSEREKHAASFDAVAALYETVRPGYPAGAVDWLVRPEDQAVVDVGAGTGKFTRLLRRAGRVVTAVEPSGNMREQLARALPDVDVLEGAGEHLPLADSSADVITFAQAWHWVEKKAASREVARVLRPGGVLGLIWNLRDERVDWVRELGVAMHADGDQYTESIGRADVRAPFGEPERAEFPWVARYTRGQLVDLVRSRSYFIVMSPDDQRATLHAVERVLQTHPQTAGLDAFELPYVTVCFRYPRP